MLQGYPRDNFMIVKVEIIKDTEKEVTLKFEGTSDIQTWLRKDINLFPSVEDMLSVCEGSIKPTSEKVDYYAKILHELESYDFNNIDIPESSPYCIEYLVCPNEEGTLPIIQIRGVSAGELGSIKLVTDAPIYLDDWGNGRRYTEDKDVLSRLFAAMREDCLRTKSRRLQAYKETLAAKLRLQKWLKAYLNGQVSYLLYN